MASRLTVSKRTAVKAAVAAAAISAGVVGLGSGLASAQPIKPSPKVECQKAPDGTCRDATQGESRSAKNNEVGGQGIVRSSPKAVPGTKAGGFGGAMVGPPLGGGW